MLQKSFQMYIPTYLNKYQAPGTFRSLLKWLSDPKHTLPLLKLQQAPGLPLPDSATLHKRPPYLWTLATKSLEAFF